MPSATSGHSPLGTVLDADPPGRLAVLVIAFAVSALRPSPAIAVTIIAAVMTAAAPWVLARRMRLVSGRRDLARPAIGFGVLLRLPLVVLLLQQRRPMSRVSPGSSAAFQRDPAPALLVIRRTRCSTPRQAVGWRRSSGANSVASGRLGELDCRGTHPISSLDGARGRGVGCGVCRRCPSGPPIGQSGPSPPEHPLHPDGRPALGHPVGHAGSTTSPRGSRH